MPGSRPSEPRYDRRVKDEVDEGSPLGGTAQLLGFGALLLSLAQIPAILLEIAWVPGCLATVAAPLAVVIGAFSLITEQSRRGRNQARLGIVLGVLVVVAQMVLVAAAPWLGVVQSELSL